MFLNLVIAGIVGFIILILWILKGVFDSISTLNSLIRKLSKITDILHYKLLDVEKLVNKKVEAKKDTTNNE